MSDDVKRQTSGDETAGSVYIRIWCKSPVKWNESGFRPPLCTCRLNWAWKTSWGWWDDRDDTVLQTQDSRFEPWRSEAEHATSRSRRLPTILTFTRGWGRNNFVSFKPPRPGTKPQTLAWKAAVLTTTLGPPPKSSVKAVHIKLLHKMVREDKKLKSRVDLFHLNCTNLLWSHRVALCMYEEQQGWMKTDLGALEPLWSCCPVLSTSLVDLLDDVNWEGDDHVDHEEYDDTYEFRWKWWVNGCTGPFRIILSVLNVLLQVQHVLAYILHTTYSADRAQMRTNPLRNHVS